MFLVENEMSSDAFVALRSRSVHTEVLKSVVTIDLVHFILDCIMPEVITGRGIEADGFVPRLGNLNTKLVTIAVRLKIQLGLMRHLGMHLNLAHIFVKAFPAWRGQQTMVKSIASNKERIVLDQKV